MGWCVIVMKDPVFHNDWRPCVTLFLSLSRISVCNTVCPAGTHSLWTIPMESKKHTSMHFTFYLDLRAFFGLRGHFEHHFKLGHLVSGSYWKNQFSLPVITQSINSGSAATCSSKPAQTLICASCWYSVRFLQIILAQIFPIPNSSVSINQTVSRFTFSSSAIILTVNLWSDQTSSLTRAALSPVHTVVVHCIAHLQPGFCLQTTFCASERLVLFTLHYLQMPAEDFHVLWWHSHQVYHKKRQYIAAWYFILPFAQQSSQTHPEISHTCST